MTHPPSRKPVPVHLTACCPEAQADGVPCTELGRDCEQCERATVIRDRDSLEPDRTDRDPATV